MKDFLASYDCLDDFDENDYYVSNNKTENQSELAKKENENDKKDEEENAMETK